jgi:hypothetical protein
VLGGRYCCYPFAGEGYAKAAVLVDLAGVRFGAPECLQNIGAYSSTGTKPSFKHTYKGNPKPRDKSDN